MRIDPSESSRTTYIHAVTVFWKDTNAKRSHNTPNGHHSIAVCHGLCVDPELACVLWRLPLHATQHADPFKGFLHHSEGGFGRNSHDVCVRRSASRHGSSGPRLFRPRMPQVAGSCESHSMVDGPKHEFFRRSNSTVSETR